MRQAFFIVKQQDWDRTWHQETFEPHITFLNWTDREYITLPEAREVYHKLGSILEETEWLKAYA